MPYWWSLSEVEARVMSVTGKDEAASRAEILQRLRRRELTARAERSYNAGYVSEDQYVASGFWQSCTVEWEHGSADYIGSEKYSSPLGPQQHYRRLEGVHVLGYGVEQLWPLAAPELAASPEPKGSPARKGRPKGTGLQGDDEPFVEVMRCMIEAGEARSFRDAAKKLAASASGCGTLESKVSRLEGRYVERFGSGT